MTIMPRRVPTVNPTPAEREFADRLAHAADGGDPDAYRPDWRKPAPPPADSLEDAGPSAEDEAYETGRAIGLEGENPLVESVSGHLASPPPRTVREAFYLGLLAGRREHARRAGYDLGVAGQFCERPGAIPRRFRREFAAGWHEGADEWADQQAILADYFQECEVEAAEDARLREFEAINREAGGWDRAANLALL